MVFYDNLWSFYVNFVHTHEHEHEHKLEIINKRRIEMHYKSEMNGCWHMMTIGIHLISWMAEWMVAVEICWQRKICENQQMDTNPIGIEIEYSFVMWHIVWQYCWQLHDTSKR